jgi:hypothetical protein
MKRRMLVSDQSFNELSGYFQLSSLLLLQLSCTTIDICVSYTFVFRTLIVKRLLGRTLMARKREATPQFARHLGSAALLLL